LFVARLDREILAVRRLVRALGPERRIRHHHVELPAVRHLIDRVAQLDLRLDTVEKQVHQSEPPRPRNQILAEIRFGFDPFGQFPLHRSALCPPHQPFIRADQEPASAAGRVADCELSVYAGVGLHAPHDGLDQHARREILTGSLLPLARRLFEKPLERKALDVHVERRPFGLVDHAEQFFQVHGIVKTGLGTRENVAQNALLPAQSAEYVDITVDQSCAGFLRQIRPVASGGQCHAALVRHLDEQQVGDLFDVVAVVDSVMPKRVAETPEFLDDVAHDSP
jgi:hypothetical protein